MSPDGSVWEFKYDRDGLRTERVYSYGGEVIVKNEYTWVDGQLTKEYRSGGMISTPITLEYYYDGEELIGFNYNGDDYYYGKTNNGEIRFIYDSNGNIVTTYHYDAWGTPLTPTGTLADTVGAVNPFRYKSYYYDSETRLYYLQSRYYDPQVGRFLNADAVDFLGVTGTLLSYNLFAYCENNAVNNIDFWGCVKINIKWMTFTINFIIWAVPVIYSVARIWQSVFKSASKLVAFGNKLILVGKQLFRKLDDRLYCFFAKESTYRVVKTLGVLAGFIEVVSSIGGLLQYLIDILDGKWDGYFDTQNYGPKFDFTKDY